MAASPLKGLSALNRGSPRVRGQVPKRTETVLAVRVENVVTSGRLSVPISLPTACHILHGATYSPTRFCGLVYHRKSPDATVILFSTGRIVSTGCRSIRAGRTALEATTRELSARHGPTIRLTELKVQNTVATSDVGGPVDLLKAARSLPNVDYEPEQFPALTWRNERRPTVLVFATGRVVCSGCRTLLEITQTIARARLDLATAGCV